MDSYSRSHPQVLIQNGQNGYATSRPQPQRPSGQPLTPSRNANGTVVSEYRLRSKYRIPTVDDALPFAPLTSIVPYSPDIIPYPSTAPPSQPNLFTNSDERRKTRASFDLLNIEASNPQRTSKLLGQSLQKLQQLLKPTDLTEYQFARPPPDVRDPHAIQALSGNRKVKVPRLSPFAQTVMDKTDVSYRYPTPETPPPINNKKDSKGIVDDEIRVLTPSDRLIISTTNRKDDPLTPRKKLRTNDTQSIEHKAAISVPAVPKVASGPAVFIPVLPSSSQRADYQEFPDVDSSVNSGKKRKRDEDSASRTILNIGRREKADAALQTLQSTLFEIFQAEDRLQPDTSGAAYVDTSMYFIKSAYNDDDTHVLTKTTQARVEKVINAVVNTSCFNEVSLDSLTRLQRLCESTISSVEALSLNLSEDSSESDVEEWVQRLELAENGLLGAKLLLKTMTGGREEKQLYSEDMLLSVLRSLEQVIDMCVIPVVETRKSGSLGPFETYSKEKKPLIALLAMCGRVMRLLGDLIHSSDVPEQVVFNVESLSMRLIFVENSSIEKDSALGSQKFETMRRSAMDVLAKIFARHPEQRSSIFSDILSSLEKLPVTRQSARQFKMQDGKPIQLVSALLMRLVQTSGARSVKNLTSHDSKPKIKELPGSDEEENESEASDEDVSPIKKVSYSDFIVSDDLNQEEAKDDLRAIVNPLNESASKDASYVIKYLVQRALTSTKSGDQPYRNLLDIFTEDFISVLGSPDWPAAEILLRALLVNMFALVEDEKRPVPAKVMALDLMGVMGSGITDLKNWLETSKRVLDPRSDTNTGLLETFADLDEGEECDITYFRGPYRVVVEYLHAQGLSDGQIQCARGYLLGQWAKSTLASSANEEGPDIREDLPLQIRNMLLDPAWLHNEYDAFESVLPIQARFASTLIMLTSQFGKALPTIMNTLVTFMTSQQPTLRSRSLKSVSDLLTKDKKMLDRNIAFLNNIIRCTQDKSAQVRDSALVLLAKCYTIKPILEGQTYTRVITLANDESVMVRKHAMRILKDIYLKSDNQDVQSAIAASLMLRVKDLEDSVSELARQTFEELWIAPFRASKKEVVELKLKLEKQVALIAKTTQRGGSAIAVLETLLQNVLAPESKHASTNFQVCKDMVAIMFDGMIDNETPSDRPSQQHLAHALTVFAKSEPKLFNSDQVQLLQPYLKNLNTTDNLPIYNSAVIIFSHVLPSLPSIENDMLRAVEGDLIQSITKLTKNELPDTVVCLWIIRGALNDPSRIVRLMRAVLQQAHKSKDLELSGEDKAKELERMKVGRYLQIAGQFAKTCNFDEQAAEFKSLFPFWQGKSVSSLVVDLIYPFTRQKYPQTLRETALESIATLCQGWPQHYLRSDVSTAFELVFHNHDLRLEHIVLTGFLMFFHSAEKRSETGAEIKVGEGKAMGQERLATSFVASDSDAGATTIAQKFLPHILRIALASTDDIALTATQVIVSVSRQGLVHPKECGPALVALETSTNKAIANTAFEEHKSVATKHETMFEKEYMKAIQQAFTYQQDVIKDPRGVTLSPVAPKLRPIFEVLKAGQGKNRKRFLGNLCTRIDFELPQLETNRDIPAAMLFARFVLENLAFFDYARVDEIIHLVACLEKLVVQGTGTVVAHAIELEILKVQIEDSSQQQQPHPSDPSQLSQQSLAKQPLDSARLRQLTVASIILSMVWETRTHLRHLWGLQKTAKNGAKTAIKDLNKAPTRTPFVSADKHLDKIAIIMTSLNTPEAQFNHCKAFAELLSVDNEVKVADENELEAELARQAAGYETPEEDVEVASNPSSTGKARKRGRPTGGVPGTPSAKRRKPAGTPKKPKANVAANGRRRSRGGSSASGDEGGGWE